MSKLAIKIFSDAATSGDLQNFVASFNEIIVNSEIPEALIDVADYTHMFNGPGVLLAGHQANWSYDCQFGDHGLLYVEKFPEESDLQKRLSSTLEKMNKVIAILEAKERHSGLKFNKEQIQISINDRSLSKEDSDSLLKEISSADLGVSFTVTTDKNYRPAVKSF